MANLVKSDVVYGVSSTDIIIRTAILAALDDIRAQPWLLDFCFQGLLHDELTRKFYGEKELQEIKSYVLNNEIAVTMAHNLNNVKQPAISIEVGDVQEIQQVLGDVHVDSRERLAFVTKIPPWMVFTPAAYDRASGVITLPDDKNTDNIFVGQRVLDRTTSTAYEILEILDHKRLRIPAGVEVNLTRAEVVGVDDLWTVVVESVRQAETFNIDCIVQGDPTKTLILEALTRFILYRYKHTLLQLRGFQNATIRASSMTFSSMYGKEASQLLWKRVASITGWTELTWPREVRPPVQGLRSQILIPTTSGAPSGDPTSAWDTFLDTDVLGSGV